jgi:hypothetical protein
MIECQIVSRTMSQGEYPKRWSKDKVVSVNSTLSRQEKEMFRENVELALE